MKKNNIPFNCVKYVTIDNESNNQRIDNFLIGTYKNIPKSHIYKIIRKGEVRVNKKRISPEYKLCTGDLVRVPPVYMIPNKPTSPTNIDSITNFKNFILFENEELLILNKPSGISVHGGSGISMGLIEQTKIYYDTDNIFLAHRLDYGTSGCLILTKKKNMLRHINELFRNNLIDKEYIALLKGNWHDECIVEENIKKNVLRSGERFVRVNNAHGKKATIKVIPVKKFQETTLVKIFPVTGRTHQIRVLTSHMGCPVVGDDKYGDKLFNKSFFAGMRVRLMLHAYSISLDIFGKKHSFFAPISSEQPNSGKNKEYFEFISESLFNIK